MKDNRKKIRTIKHIGFVTLILGSLACIVSGVTMIYPAMYASMALFGVGFITYLGAYSAEENQRKNMLKNRSRLVETSFDRVQEKSSEKIVVTENVKNYENQNEDTKTL